MNPFMRIHYTRDGKSMPIISMQADHLVNMVNLALLKMPRKALEAARKLALTNYAPEGVDRKAAEFLRLKELTLDEQAHIEEQLRDLRVELLNTAFDEIKDYILVGLVRDDTRAGVLKIVQEATGITGYIEIAVATQISNGDLELLADDLTLDDFIELEDEH